MRKDLPRMRTQMNLIQARNLLVKNKLSGAPVFDPLGQLVGVFSVSDLKDAIRDTNGKLDRRKRRYQKEVEHVFSAADSVTDELSEITVEDYMTSEVDSIEPSMPLTEAAELMKENQIHRLLVVGNQILRGMLCVEDLPPRFRPDD